MFDMLILQATEERLCNGVIIKIAETTHAWLQAYYLCTISQSYSYLNDYLGRDIYKIVIR